MNYGSVLVRAEVIFLFSKTSTLGLMPTQPTIQWVTWVSEPTRGKGGVKVKVTTNFHLHL